MKKNTYLLPLLGIILLGKTVLGGDPSPFDLYKNMTQEERQHIKSNAAAEKQKEYARWDRSISLGGQWWNYKDMETIREAKPFSSIRSFIGVYMNYWRGLYQSKWESMRKGGLTAEKRAEIDALFAKVEALNKEAYKDEWWYLIRLAATPEAKELDKKAEVLALKWYNRLQEPVNYTDDKTREMDADMKEIRDKMRQLPHLSPEQIESMLGNLPEAEEHR